MKLLGEFKNQEVSNAVDAQRQNDLGNNNMSVDGFRSPNIDGTDLT